MRGGANFASFATGKFAMRALMQSLAREFGPKGIHVVHAIIDGVIDIPRTKEWKFDAPDAKIDPEAVSDSFYLGFVLDMSVVVTNDVVDRGCVLVLAYTTENELYERV